MNKLIPIVAMVVTTLAYAQTNTLAESVDSPDQAAQKIASAMANRLQTASQQLDVLRKQIADEKIPLAQKLAEAESSVSALRKNYDAVKREADGIVLQTSSLRTEIKTRETERNYLCSLIGEYARNTESRLHIAELEIYKDSFETARTAQERLNDAPAEAFLDQLRMTLVTLSRLEELAGGLTFKGGASSEDGIIKQGNFLILGPVAYFLANDHSLVGIANQRIGSMKPIIEPFNKPEFALQAKEMLASNQGMLPFDASLGNARKVEETNETLKEHFLKGGSVMWPMLLLLGLAAFVVLFKLLYMAFIPMPSARKLATFLDAINSKDAGQIEATLKKIRGPAGAMLRAGVAVLDQPRELIEEAMFEKVLQAKFRINRFIPFIAVTAACAPLLGLLGTVTGIISTFKLMTIFGSGDVKVLSSGISEALITTEFGLYIAIPAVLIHSFLSRKAKSFEDRLEQIAIRFMGEIGKV